MSLALLKLASPKNLLRLATAYEETEELTERTGVFLRNMTNKSYSEWKTSDPIGTAWVLIQKSAKAGSAWKSALKPVVKLLLKYLRKAKEKA